MRKNGRDQLHSTAQLISAFFFAYSKIGFSHDAAHISLPVSQAVDILSTKNQTKTASYSYSNSNFQIEMNIRKLYL